MLTKIFLPWKRDIQKGGQGKYLNSSITRVEKSWDAERAPIRQSKR